MANSQKITGPKLTKHPIQLQYEDLVKEVVPQQDSNFVPYNRKQFDRNKNGNQKYGENLPENKRIKLKMDMQPDAFLNKQAKFSINGVEVYFPFKPYDCQKDFMTKAI